MKNWGTLLVALLLSGMAWAEDAERLYQTNCAVCHGQQGEGGIGLPLASAAVMRSVTDDYLKKTILHGRPGRVMPGFTNLREAEIDALVKYLRRWGKSEVAETGKPAMGDVLRGKKHFQQHCASCHGTELKGGSEGTGVTFSRDRELRVMPPALGNSGFLQSVSDDMLRFNIRHGRVGTAMEGYGDKLSAQDIDDLIVYIRKAAAAKQPEDVEGNGLLMIAYDAPYDFEETVQTLRDVIKAHNFRTFPDRFLEQGLTDEFSVNQRQLSIRFCNFNQLYEALKLEPRLGVLLPCAITVVEHENGDVQLIAANIKAMSRLFNNDQLSDLMGQLQDSYDAILEEVTF